MTRIITMTLAGLILCIGSSAMAGHSFIEFDDAGDMVISGPFSVTIPKPKAATGSHGPEHSTPSFLDGSLKISKAAYSAADQLVVVQIEETAGGVGTLTTKHLPVIALAGEDFYGREACVDISQQELDADDDPLFEFIEQMNVQIVPAVMSMQLMFISDDATTSGMILFLRNVPDGCDSMSDDFGAKFKSDFERFIESIRAAN